MTRQQPTDVRAPAPNPTDGALLVPPGFQFSLILKPRGARCRKQSSCLCRESHVPSDSMDTTEKTSMRSAAALQLPRFRCQDDSSCGRTMIDQHEVPLPSAPGELA